MELQQILKLVLAKHVLKIVKIVKMQQIVINAFLVIIYC